MLNIQPEIPPYDIIASCEQIDIHAPVDRPWYSRVPGTAKSVCCGRDFPLELCVFTLKNKQTVTYRIGQCPVCQGVSFATEEE